MNSLPKTTKAAVLVEHGQPDVIQEVPIPALRPNCIIAKVLLAGVCGTDVHQHHGTLEFKPPLPNIQGHETLGEIVELGEGRDFDIAGQPLRPGDRIMWAHPFCGKCYYCAVHRKPYMCEKMGPGYGFSAPEFLRGGFAEYCYIDEVIQVVRVPDSVRDEEALGVGCAFRTVVSGFERLQKISAIGTADSVVIQGCGPIGLYSTLLASHSGAGKVIVVGAPSNRLELAREWGATHTINIDEIKDHAERAKIVLDLTDGRGAEFCIEAAGVPEAFLQGFDFMRKDCTYLVMGQTSTKTVPFMPNTLQQKQACVIGSVGADARHFYKALKFIEAHRDRIDFSKIISSTYDLEDINAAIDNMGKGVDIKGAIDNRRRI